MSGTERTGAGGDGAGCIGTPVSWLRLEMRAVGDLDAAELAEIDAHLAACPACAACAARIPLDDADLQLKPLTSVSANDGDGRRAAVVPLRRHALVTGSVLAIAAAIALWVKSGGPRSAGGRDESWAGSSHVKGGDVAFTLVRDDQATIADAAGTFRDGDRFKAVVTCPPGATWSWDVVVYEAGEASFPLTPAIALPCGNGVPLPGAFRLTGAGSMTVCVVWSEGAPVDRDALRRAQPVEGERAACKRLDAAP